MSKTKRYQPKVKSPKPKNNYKSYYCSCGLNVVEKPGDICWECEVLFVD